jgi:long-subunit acyl-CoA synthetase (AMP-forming)
VTIKGQRFFRTGDIGQINKDGSLSIIDRKKDLFEQRLKKKNGKGHACWNLERNAFWNGFHCLQC